MRGSNAIGSGRRVHGVLLACCCAMTVACVMGCHTAPSHDEDLNAAVDRAEHLVRVDANVPGSWYELYKARSERGEKTLALQALRRAVKLDPTRLNWRYDMAVLLAELGRHAEALDEANQLLQESSDLRFKSTVQAFRGNRYFDLGDMRRAQEAYQSAIKCDPSSPRGFLGLGAVAGELGDWKEARQHFKKALAVAKRPRDKAKAHCGLGMANEMTGDLVGARREYRAALSAYPRLADAQEGLQRIGR